jgi:acetyl esterase/lipase
MTINISTHSVLQRTTLIIIATLICYSFVPAQPLTVKIWHNTPPGSFNDPSYIQDTVFTDAGRPRIRHVTDPEMYIYLPDDHHVNRTAVIICPGGSYTRLALDHEGVDVAKWFTQYGVVGIVLKYRLPSDQIMKNKSVGPLQDAQEAIRFTRRKAKEWYIDPNKIGIMGFSAGGHLAASASTLYNYRVYEPTDSVSARPDFSLLIYGVLTMKNNFTHVNSKKNLLGDHPDSVLVERFSPECQVNSKTPPAFIVHASNDSTVPAFASVQYYSALRKHAVPAELHIYETGGHGFGLARDRKSESGWTEACLNWMKIHGLIP